MSVRQAFAWVVDPLSSTALQITGYINNNYPLTPVPRKIAKELIEGIAIKHQAKQMVSNLGD
ncbi:MAG: hypothetical protein HY940_06720 [Gammaproteobacteria bacterium]|nr:hypothetical protein [Gammaproteobacteria bacterium]